MWNILYSWDIDAHKERHESVGRMTFAPGKGSKTDFDFGSTKICRGGYIIAILKEGVLSFYYSYFLFYSHISVNSKKKKSTRTLWLSLKGARKEKAKLIKSGS